MDKLKLYWPHPKVLFNGKGISEAWAEEMLPIGFDIVQDPSKADIAVFISDSQLDPDVIGKIPTIAYFWGWLYSRAFEDGFGHFAQEKVNMMAACTRVLVPSLTTYYQLCDFQVPSQMCLPGVDSRTLDVIPGECRRKGEVLFLSRIVPHKNLEALIGAMSLLEPRISLRIVGSGEEEYVNQIIETVKGLEIPLEIVSPDDKEKVKLIKETGILVFPSVYEGFGLPPLEAMYLGTPVIAWDIPQMRHLLQENAYFVSSIEGLAGTIIDIFNNYPEAHNKAQKARQWVASTYTLKQAAQRLWAHLHQVHKEFWAGKLRQDVNNPALVKQAYEERHRQNWAYGMAEFDPSAPYRFNPEWARHWRAQHFINTLKERGVKKILDVGCSEVYPTIMAKAGFDVTGLDVADEALAQARFIAEKWGVGDKVLLQQGYAQHLPYKDGEFDGVVLGEILEHVPDPDVVLKEAMRVLRPGGCLVASTPYGSHHYDPFHIAGPEGGWSEERMTWLLGPWQKELVKVDKIAEDGAEPSCFFIVMDKVK